MVRKAEEVQSFFSDAQGDLDAFGKLLRHIDQDFDDLDADVIIQVCEAAFGQVKEVPGRLRPLMRSPTCALIGHGSACL